MNLRPGDLVGFAGSSMIDVAINLATWGWPLPWPAAWRGVSHVAIAVELPDAGLVLCESLPCPPVGDLPCAVRGVPSAGVQAHVPGPRLLHDLRAGAIVWHYPLTTPLRLVERMRLTAFADSLIGVPYDYRGAWHSRSKPLGLLARRWLGDNGLHAIFCSELVAACWLRIGRDLKRWPSYWAPNPLCRSAIAAAICMPPLQLHEADL